MDKNKNKEKPSKVVYLQKLDPDRIDILRERAASKKNNTENPPIQSEADDDLQEFSPLVQKIAKELRDEYRYKIELINLFYQGEVCWMDLGYREVLVRYLEKVQDSDRDEHIVWDLATDKEIVISFEDKHGNDRLPYILDEVTKEDI